MSPLLGVLLIGLSVAPRATEDSSLGPTSVGQAAADALKTFSGADGALIPAGVISQPLASDDLSTVLSYPNDSVEVVELKGSQLRSAFELSAMLYPQANVGFLQVAGFEITFNQTRPPKSRVTAVTLNGSKLEDGHTYNVAMPASLQRGQLGYANLWDKAKIARTFSNANMGSVLHGKHSSESAPRWIVQG